MTDNATKDVLDRLLSVLVQMDVGNLPEIRSRFALVLSNYQIGPKEEALVVYTEGKNEMYLKKFILAAAEAASNK